MPVPMSPLFTAINQREVAKIKELLTTGTSVKELRAEHITPLQDAVYGKQVEIAEVLLEHGADPNEPNGDPRGDGSTAVIWAADRADLPMVKLLLSRGADVKFVNTRQETALHQAVSDKTKKHFAVMEALIEAGADVNSAAGETPLMEASRNGSPEMVKTLIAKGARVNQNSPSGTALHYAVDRIDGARADNVQVLLEHGADLALVDVSDDTALDIAREAKSRKVIKILEEAFTRAGKPVPPKKS